MSVSVFNVCLAISLCCVVPICLAGRAPSVDYNWGYDHGLGPWGISKYFANELQRMKNYMNGMVRDAPDLFCALLVNGMMSASRTYPTDSRLSPENGKLASPGGWAPNDNTQDDWIQIEFSTVQSVDGIVMESRAMVDQWVTTYKVQYSLTSTGTLFNVGAPTVFKGNVDRGNRVSAFFSRITAKRIRITPLTYRSWKSMRFAPFRCDNFEFQNINPPHWHD